MTTTSSFMSALPALVMAFSVMLQGAARNRGRTASQYTSTERHFFLFRVTRTKPFVFGPAASAKQVAWKRRTTCTAGALRADVGDKEEQDWGSAA
jgi:hypothetical protein